MYVQKCILKSIAVEEQGSKVIVTFPNTQYAITNGSKINMVICQNLPADTLCDNVILDINGEEFDLITCTGNNVKVAQIKSRKCYTIRFGTENITAVMISQIPCLSNYPIIEIPTITKSLKTTKKVLLSDNNK